MPSFEKVAGGAGSAGGAGDVDGRFVYRVLFGGSPCSDQPQLQAWDDEALATTASESLVGTVNNGGKSQIAAAHTTNTATGGQWVPAAPVAGEGLVQNPNGLAAGHRANRLKGQESFLGLYDPGDAPPVAGEYRYFQLASMVHDDSSTGTSGHLPVLAVKTFYAGAAPVVDFEYNAGVDDLTVAANGTWKTMTSSPKGTPMAINILNTIHFTGPASTTTSLDPVVKPGAGEKAAEAQWIQTVL